MMVQADHSRFTNKHKQMFSNFSVDIPKVLKHTYFGYFIRILFFLNNLHCSSLMEVNNVFGIRLGEKTLNNSWPSRLGVCREVSSFTQENCLAKKCLTRKYWTDNFKTIQACSKDEKGTLDIVTWNVNTMLKAGEMQEIADQIVGSRIQIVALQEIRWRGYSLLNILYILQLQPQYHRKSRNRIHNKKSEMNKYWVLNQNLKVYVK